MRASSVLPRQERSSSFKRTTPNCAMAWDNCVLGRANDRATAMTSTATARRIVSMTSASEGVILPAPKAAMLESTPSAA